MRVATLQLYQDSIRVINNQNYKLNHIQEQLATGLRVLTPADDPTAATRALDLSNRVAENEQYLRNGGFLESKLMLEESSMQGVEDIMQRVRELTIQAGSEILSPLDRAAISSEVRQLYKQTVSISNSVDSNGEYLFAGYQSAQTPFIKNAVGDIVYNGDQGQRMLSIAPDVQIASGDSGFDVFEDIKNGNGTFYVDMNMANTGNAVIGANSLVGNFVLDDYTIDFTQAVPTDPITYTVSGAVSGVVTTGTYATVQDIQDAQVNNDELEQVISFNGVQLEIAGTPADTDQLFVRPSQNQSIFTTMKDLINTLEITGKEPADLARVRHGINRALGDLNQDMDHISRIRTDVGARLNAIDQQSFISENLITEMQTIRSNLVDIDYPTAISKLNQEILGLQSAQRTFVRVQNLSIFNFL